MTDFFTAREVLENEKISLLAGFGLGVGYMSIIGPFRIGIINGFSNSDRYFSAVKGYISIGYRF
jgi:outer membrane translocation and assembly module TamA